MSDLHLFALWSSHHEDDPNRPHRFRIAVPDGPDLTVRSIACDLVDTEGLRTLDVISSPSLLAWRNRAVEGGGGAPAALPVAAYAEVDPTGTAITSPAHAMHVFDATSELESDLRWPDPVRPRPYQIRGIQWLAETVDVHGGALLADEMGLGKTLQAIGLLRLRGGDGPQLVVCPKSLISNWIREISRFAPELTPTTDPSERGKGVVVVISYPILRTRSRGDHATQSVDVTRDDDVTWATVVFDEAHALKNPRTQVARAARDVSAEARVALTGTPVENDLDELWAILRAVTPRLFPHRAVFRRRFSKAVAAGDAGAVDRLRVAVAPVMLARSKTQVASALPPKIDNPVLCDLTAEQADLYDRHLAAITDDGFGTGVGRHGRILATLTRLKQICNHPALVTGDSAETAGRSGKLDICTDVLRDNMDRDAPTLVFTQYRKTGELLRRHLTGHLALDIPFYHGGLVAAIREQMVDGFQAGTTAPVMIMSLKAGGVGLTLTRACDVIHFDRWWNPAVESQASDRVHRIGQRRPVTITTLTTATTVEEHIATMHVRKSAIGTHAGDNSMIAELAAMSDRRLIEILERSRGDR
ncbi:DEAD/DEAH box helicase [Gordonia soli]|uniref:Putative helicase n=1 Tax=Gordonia soli NBRC 108243 TaxID=1223545 RepID=M0QR53_9ACTN|nr:DEAD/DEAH box helicase [Gordonia soli]GAC69907.1 putative helicase [Gordonia soli NBRC 108243]